MRRLLIADSSEVYISALVAALREEFTIETCGDGETALALLQSYRPDLLILNLMLPYKDGITILQQTAFRPSIILALTNYVNSYVEQSITDLGVDYTMISPSPEALCLRLRDLIARSEQLPGGQDLTSATIHYLHRLNFPTHLDGYRQLCIALPMFTRNPQQLLTKELYPAVAAQCGRQDSRSVEHSIRKAIQAAWKQQDRTIWKKIFPHGTKGRAACPTNKEFLCRMAELLNETMGAL